MEQSNIPSQAELSSLYGAWNPMGYMRGISNQNLADQFRQQAFQGNQADISAKLQANAQAEKINPLLLAQQELVNTGKGLNNTNQELVNRGLGLDVEKKAAIHSDTIEAERQALRSKIGDEKYNQLSTSVLNAHIDNLKNGDPAEIEKTGRLLDMLGGPSAGKVGERVQNRQLAELQRLTQQQIASGNNAATIQAAQIAADSRYQVASLHAQNVLDKAQKSQNAEQYYVSLQKAGADPELIAQARKDWLDSKAAYQNAIDLKALAEGSGVQRQGDRASTPKLGTAENPIVLK